MPQLTRKVNPINFDSLLEQGLVEFIDVEEEENTMIAMFIRKL